MATSLWWQIPALPVPAAWASSGPEQLPKYILAYASVYILVHIPLENLVPSLGP